MRSPLFEELSQTYLHKVKGGQIMSKDPIKGQGSLNRA